MNEETPDFDALLERIRGLVSGPGDARDKLDAVCEALKDGVGHYNWVGFYLADPAAERRLVLGPFRGEPTEHTQIPFGRGICGQAAEARETFVVPDVSREENYLCCDARVKSEIVLPVLDEGRIVGELDIDSHVLNAFSPKDTMFLEEVCHLVARLMPRVGPAPEP